MSDYTELCARLRALLAGKKPHPGSGATPQTMGCESYRLVATGNAFAAIEEAADALEAQAREIAELRAQLAKLDEKLSCGHRKLDHDDSYGGCTFCGFANGYHEYERDNDKLEAERDAAHFNDVKGEKP